MTLAADPVTGSSPLRGTEDGRDRQANGVWFLRALLLATAIPLLAIPLIAHVGHPNLGLEKTRELIFFLGSGSHVAASFLLYVDRSLRPTLLRRPLRFFFVPVAILAGSVGLFTFAHGDITATALTAYLIWQIHHYTRQNIGVLAFSAKATRCTSPTELEKAAVMTSGYAGILGMITLMTPYGSTPLRSFGWQLHTMAALVFAAALVLMAVALPASMRTGNPWRVGFFVASVLFYLPVLLFHDVISATSSFALAHGFQYLVFMWWVAQTGRKKQERRVMIGAVAALVVLGGLALALMQDNRHWHGLAQPVFGAYLGVVMIHFVIDAGVWHLRDPEQRAYMRRRFPFLA